MKKIFVVFFALCISWLCHSQDIETLNGIGYDQIISRLGEPVQYERSDYDGQWYRMYYNTMSLTIDYFTGAITYYTIWDNSFVVLSQYIDGGLRVGDPVSRIPAGLGNLHALAEPIPIYRCPFAHNYIMFDGEEYFYWLSIQDGIICAITKNQSEDITNVNEIDDEIEEE